MASLVREPLKVFFLGTYLPRKCGIATFTYDLRQAFLNSSNPSPEAYVMAITNTPNHYDYPEEVVFEINQNSVLAYHQAGEYVNFSDADLVCVQHEFGIFGGEAGSHLSHFLSRVEKPVVTTLHTVLADPKDSYYRSLQQVIKFSDYLVVMAEKARELLIKIYDAPKEKIRLIPHGIPLPPPQSQKELKKKLALEGKKVLLTFGLLSPNKGIEVVIDALPEILSKNPEVVYVVAGATHPEVKKHQGEKYREFLTKKAQQNGVLKQVIFVDKFLSLEELREYIGACDIYISPYWVREQIVSGTLSYTVGMGKPVISTPSWYAEEILSDGRGILIDFGDFQGLAGEVNRLFSQPELLEQISRRARKFGKKLYWSEVGKAYAELFQEAVEGKTKFSTLGFFPSGIYSHLRVDRFQLEHFLNLTDDTGIIQHSFYHIPERKTGYSTDDVGRALEVMMKYWEQSKDPRALQLAEKYLSFLRYSQREEGLFHNFMSYHRQFLDERGSDDTQGRALLGLGATLLYGPDQGWRAPAKESFEQGFEAFESRYPMAIAYALQSVWYYLKRYPGARAVRSKAQMLAERLYQLYLTHSDSQWKWVSARITYGAGKIPTAFLLAGEMFNEEKFLTAGEESLEFLIKSLDRGDYFDLVGNQGWFPKGKEPALFDQQPICAGYLVEALVLAYQKSGEKKYRLLAQKAFEWFLGRNRLGIPLYDPNTGGCRDGLRKDGVNFNQGAESLICFWEAFLNLNQLQAQLGLLDYKEEEKESPSSAGREAKNPEKPRLQLAKEKNPQVEN